MLISKKAEKIVPYAAGEQPQESGWIKLNTNENPYPAAPFDIFDDCARLRLYCDPNATRLKQAIAALHGVDAEQVFVGNGSDEVLAIAFQSLFNTDGAPVLAPDISYSFYPVYASLYDIPYQPVPLREDFSLSIVDYDRPCGGVVFANPNAPTSLVLKRESVLKLVDAHADVPVIVDEAYVDFASDSVVGDVSARKNLLVVRTLSKSYSLAGLRVGYAIGSRALIDAMERIKNCFNSYTVDTLAQNIAENAIKRQDMMLTNVKKIVETRVRTIEALRATGFTVLDSGANFLFAKHKTASGKEIFDGLKSRKILVRRWDAPRISEYLRITIGTDSEMTQLNSVLREILK